MLSVDCTVRNELVGTVIKCACTLLEKSFYRENREMKANQAKVSVEVSKERNKKGT